MLDIVEEAAMGKLIGKLFTTLPGKAEIYAGKVIFFPEIIYKSSQAIPGMEKMSSGRMSSGRISSPPTVVAPALREIGTEIIKTFYVIQYLVIALVK